MPLGMGHSPASMSPYRSCPRLAHGCHRGGQRVQERFQGSVGHEEGICSELW